MIRKADETFVRCGNTLLPDFGRQVPEVGYLLQPPYRHAGCATEVASACKRLASGPLDMERICTFIRDSDSDFASQHVALRYGMRRTAPS